MTPIEILEIGTSTAVPVAMPSFEAIEPGATAAIVRLITAEDVQRFASLSGDDNPLHMDQAFARRTDFQNRVVHGMLVASYVSTLIGTRLPGSGSLWTQQSFRWKKPVFIGDRLEIGLTVTHKSVATRTVTVEVKASNQHGLTVLEGEGVVMMPELREEASDHPLDERVAFLNGDGGSLCVAIAAALESAGVRVAANFRGDTPVDTRDSRQVSSVYEKVRCEFGSPVSLLVNCVESPVAGRPFAETEWSGFQEQIDSQVRSAVVCCSAAVPGMREVKGGVINNIGSLINWNVPPPHVAPLAVAAAALKALTRSLAVELGPFGIRVNMISPGAGPSSGDSGRLRKVQAMQTPLRRLGAPEDIAQTVVFLASDAGRFITGVDIPVCGGVAM